MATIAEAPQELQDSIREFWPEEEWDNAANVSLLESGWNAFALNDSTDGGKIPCGAAIGVRNGVNITAERSVGWFQINTCNIPQDWHWYHLFNTRHNCGTAHDMWSRRGWEPWYFSARELGLL